MRENYIWGLSKKYNNEVSFWIEDEYDDVKIMVKLWNKSIQGLESYAVRKHYGSHFLQWINNENNNLDEAIEKSLNVGYTRIEMTFHTDEIPSQDMIDRNFEFVYDIIKNKSDVAIFYNTMNNQFTN